MAKTSPVEFVQQVREEARKITWPSRKEVMISTVMVMIMVAMASVFFLVVDCHSEMGHRQAASGPLKGAAESYGIGMTKRWYIVHAYSNFEKKVAESIKEQSVQKGLGDLFEQVLVPTEEIIEVRRGRKIKSERRFFPGYVLVKMELTDQAFHLIKNTPKVTGFLGSDSKPIPISDAEANRILNQVAEGVDKPKTSISFEIGEQVRVADGPFASFNGQVEEVDEERSRLKVAVSIFGRPTPVELEYGQVEKIR